MNPPALSLAAFNAVILAEQDLLFTLASLLVGDERRAEAAVQQACQAAYRRQSGPGRAAAREALLSSLVQACAPRWWEGGDLRRRGTAVPANGDRPLAGHLDGLPFRSRAALALVELAGLSYGEAARVLGCTDDQVRSSLASGRQQLAGMALEVAGSQSRAG